MQKIIFLTRDGYELPTARIRGYFFAKELERLGVETEVLSFRDHFKAPNIDTACFSEFKKLLINISAFLKLIKEKQAIFYVQKVSYHCLSIFLAAWINRNKVIIDYDDWEEAYRPFSWLRIETLVKWVAKRAWGCIASSRYLYLYLSEYNQNTYFLPTGPDENLFYVKNMMDKEEIVFSWAGRLDVKRMFDNLVFIIECFSQIVSTDKHVVLEIVGIGPLLPHVENFAKTKYTNCDIRFKESIPPDKMSQYYDTVDVGLVPLIQCTKFNFSKSPAKMFEYMAKGIPVIASKAGEPSLILTHGEDGFLAETKQEFIYCMKQLVENKELRIDVGKKARKLIKEKYGLTVLAEKLKAIIEKCQIEDFNR